MLMGKRTATAMRVLTVLQHWHSFPKNTRIDLKVLGRNIVAEHHKCAVPTEIPQLSSPRIARFPQYRCKHLHCMVLECS